jgi:single-strand DNA-binding protein
MASFHQTIIMGNVGKEPELRYTANGTALCKFSVAVNETYIQDGERKEKAIWYNVTAFGKGAENAGQYLEKGQQVLIRGKMNFGQFEKQDGSKGYSSDLIADPFGIIFLGKGRNRDEGVNDDLDLDDIPFEG